MTITERTLSPDQRAMLLTILSDVAAIRAQLEPIQSAIRPEWHEENHSPISVIDGRLNAIAHKVKEINGGGKA